MFQRQHRKHDWNGRTLEWRKQFICIRIFLSIKCCPSLSRWLFAPRFILTNPSVLALAVKDRLSPNHPLVFLNDERFESTPHPTPVLIKPTFLWPGDNCVVPKGLSSYVTNYIFPIWYYGGWNKMAYCGSSNTFSEGCVVKDVVWRVYVITEDIPPNKSSPCWYSSCGIGTGSGAEHLVVCTLQFTGGSSISSTTNLSILATLRFRGVPSWAYLQCHRSPCFFCPYSYKCTD